MKNSLWPILAAVGIAVLSACGHDDNNATSTQTGNSPPGSSGPTSSAPSSAPPPTDFVAFVSQQIGPPVSFFSAPAVTTALTTDLGLDNAQAFFTVSFGSGDALPAGTNQGSVACTQAGATHCNPTVSADLNSTLN